MDAVLSLLAEHVILLIFVLLAIGAVLGQVRIAGVQVGPAAVLFTAIGLTALASARGFQLSIPAALGTIGLALFTYAIGVQSGPGFFATLRTNLRPMVMVVGVLCAAAAAAVGLGTVLGLPAPVVAGSFAGALTNTPALAAAIDAAGDSAGPTVGYSITYLFGVIGMLLCAVLALRSKAEDAVPTVPLTNLTIRVERAGTARVKDIEAAYNGKIAFSRVQHGEEKPIEVAADDVVLGPDDLVSVVGPADLVERLAGELGHPSSHSLLADRRYLDFRRITLSKVDFAGHTVKELGLQERFGAVVTRVRRGDDDLLAHDAMVLQPGDRLRVIAPMGRMKEISTYLGDSARGAADINPIGFGVGMTLGFLLGLVHFPLPGGGFSLGTAAGTLIVGLVFGRLGRVGPLVTTMPNNAAATLSQFGMLVFLAYAGTTAGALFVEALGSGEGLLIALLGAVVTAVAGVGLLLVGRLMPGVGGPRLAGILGGTQTQPAVLAYANERTNHDSRVSLGYAMVYPVAMIAKILLGQLLGSL